jgi:hypothetical protein
MSASSSGAAWELRCEVREKLNEFLMTNYPECLPRFRTSILPSGLKQNKKINKDENEFKDNQHKGDIS